MLELLKSFDLSIINWCLLCVCCFMIGVSKSGFAGLGMVIIPIMAVIFQAKISVGILLPMLIVGDIIAAKHYKKDIDWHYLIKLSPWVLIGISCGVYVGEKISDDWFKYLIAISIFTGLAFMLFKGKKVSYPKCWWFSAIFGLSAGFFTMIGNAAGALMSIYLLSVDLPKNKFIGTRAWFFLIVNLIKIPLHIFIWGTISYKTISLNLIMAPIIILGTIIGIKLIKMINENIYRYLIIISIILAGLKLLI